MIYDYCLFNHGFKFQDSVCNGCHDLTVLNVITSDITIITIKNVDYCCIIHNISKSEAINLLKNYVVGERWYIYFTLFKTVFAIYKTVDCEYSTNSRNKSLEILKLKY